MNAASSRQTRGVNHKALLRLVTDYLDTLPCWYAKLAGGAYQKPGLPDLIAAIPWPDKREGAQFVGIEIKTGHAKQTLSQLHEQLGITEAGGYYCLMYSIEELEDFLLLAKLLEAPRLMRFGKEDAHQNVR